MKYQILFGVVFLTLLSYCYSEIEDEFENFVDEEMVEADDPFSLARKDKENCIPKHHECTSDRHGCCRGSMFKYKCQCVKIVNAQKEETERCACITPGLHKAAEFVVQLFKKVIA
uniref:U5-lycotoxin-Ls1a n=1 Tax=Lycosa singoriensis TaxID=434756 RepID=TX501_LYCSI|nr:RecName: Full=U5-lycotoxin-Ls1a; AltName: Full=Toxin-like structure LSTX-E1; Flags: Precursor [Lycosa singoriensis]ACI41366.1 toxin-like structure LSTX-E1 precursor [Lycosa singoriensis]CAS03635.1 toxin-like structure LSTX-E1 precursor [Lycosa singoriensis]